MEHFILAGASSNLGHLIMTFGEKIFFESLQNLQCPEIMRAAQPRKLHCVSIGVQLCSPTWPAPILSFLSVVGRVEAIFTDRECFDDFLQ